MKPSDARSSSSSAYSRSISAASGRVRAPSIAHAPRNVTLPQSGHSSVVPRGDALSMTLGTSAPPCGLIGRAPPILRDGGDVLLVEAAPRADDDLGHEPAVQERDEPLAIVARALLDADRVALRGH